MLAKSKNHDIRSIPVDMGICRLSDGVRSRRVITDKRREQNRIAQKAHREKQKRRLQELTRLVESQEVGSGSKPSVFGLPEFNEFVPVQDKDVVPNRYDDNSAPLNSFTTPHYSYNSDTLVDQLVVTESTELSNNGEPTPSNSGDASNNRVFSPNLGSFTRSSGLSLRPPGVSSGPGVQLTNHEQFFGALDQYAISWSSAPTLLEDDPASTPAGATVQESKSQPSVATKTLCQWLLNSETDSQRLDELLNRNNISVRDILLAGMNAYSEPLNNGSQIHPVSTIDPHSLMKSPLLGFTRSLPPNYSHMWDLRKNHITLPQISIMAAFMANAALLGISAEESLTYNLESPFHLRHLLTRDIESVGASYASLKEDLRPTHAQLTISHPMYIDVFPFPEFRNRFIMLRSAASPIFSEDDICADIDGGGVVCWGSGSSSGSGTPWDMRSWEIKPWFIKKYWFLTGGVGSKMYNQSKWWHELRGERFEDRG